MIQSKKNTTYKIYQYFKVKYVYNFFFYVHVIWYNKKIEQLEIKLEKEDEQTDFRSKKEESPKSSKEGKNFWQKLFFKWLETVIPIELFGYNYFKKI